MGDMTKTGEQDGIYGESPQPLGKRSHMSKANEVCRPQVEELRRAAGIEVYDPSLEEVCNRVVTRAAGNNIDHTFVVFGGRKPRDWPPIVEVETAETDLQTVEHKFFPILYISVVLGYDGTPVMCRDPQIFRAVVPFG